MPATWALTYREAHLYMYPSEAPRAEKFRWSTEAFLPEVEPPPPLLPLPPPAFRLLACEPPVNIIFGGYTATTGRPTGRPRYYRISLAHQRYRRHCVRAASSLQTRPADRDVTIDDSSRNCDRSRKLELPSLRYRKESANKGGGGDEHREDAKRIAAKLLESL